MIYGIGDIFKLKINSMKRIITLALLISLSQGLRAQTAEDSVKAVINQLFTAMRNADTVMLHNCFSERPIMQTIVKDKEGNTLARTDLLENFVKQIGSIQKNAADERIVFESIRIDGPLASVWTPYQFFLNGQFSHCGANSFQLLRTKTGWKIQYLIDTRRKEGCGG